MPKASTQDGLDEGILEASLDHFPHQRKESRGKPVPLLSFVPSKKSSWNGPRRHQHPSQLPSMSGPLPVCCFPLLPFFPAYLSIFLSTFPLPHPPACHPAKPSSSWPPAWEKKELPILGCYPHQGFTSFFSYLPSFPAHFPHPTQRQHTNTHAHAHAHAHFPDLSLA